MNLTLQKLKVTNFKGIDSLEIEFNHVTDVFGKNKSGKTSLADAISYLLFGKDTSDRKDFEITPLDANNTSTNLDSIVRGIFDKDGKELILERRNIVKMGSRRGEEVQFSTGNETRCFINQVPCKTLSEYNSFIKSLLDEDLFKIITNPLYFAGLAWEKKREILINLVGDVTDEHIANKSEKFGLLLKNLNGRPIAEQKAILKGKIKAIKSELDIIPTQVNEADVNMPLMRQFDILEESILTLKNEISEIDAKIADNNKAYESKFAEKSVLQNELFELKNKKTALENKAREEVNEYDVEYNLDLELIKSRKFAAEHKLNALKQDIAEKNSEVASKESSIDLIEDEISKLRERWEKENAKEIVFNENDFSCPTCKTPFKNIEELKSEFRKSFNENKLNELSGIKNRAEIKKKEKDVFIENIKSIKESIEALNAEKEVAEKEVAEKEVAENNFLEIPREQKTWEEILFGTEKYESLLAQIKEKQDEIDSFVINVDNSELQAMKEPLQMKIDEMNKALGTKKVIEDTNARINELKEKQRVNSQMLADLERQEFDIYSFEKAKMDEVSERVNSLFKLCKIKMFEIQLNGEERPICEILDNGVPFSNTNNASKINIGLDIINVFCEKYNITVPIIIDNREGISDIIETKSQIINLIVDRNCEKLTIKKINHGN